MLVRLDTVAQVFSATHLGASRAGMDIPAGLRDHVVGKNVPLGLRAVVG